jgi:hypothetical protein
MCAHKPVNGNISFGRQFGVKTLLLVDFIPQGLHAVVLLLKRGKLF